MSRAKARVGLATLLAILVTAPAAAELLVTRAGQVIETRGEWQVRGKLLVFELADGTLASLRAEEADLEASEKLNLESAQRAQRAREVALRPVPEPASAAMVITDRDVLTVRDLPDQAPQQDGPGAEAAATGPGSPDAGGDGDAASEAAREDLSSGGVQVVEWSQEPEGDTSLAVRGVIQNLGASFATGLSVNTLFYDEAGLLVAAREVRPEGGPLRPGERREFSVSVPDALVYQEIRFLVMGRGFRSVSQSVGPDGPPPPAGPGG